MNHFNYFITCNWCNSSFHHRPECVDPAIVHFDEIDQSSPLYRVRARRKNLPGGTETRAEAIPGPFPEISSLPELDGGFKTMPSVAIAAT